MQQYGGECKLRVEFLEKQYAWELLCDKVGRNRKDLLESPSIHRLAEFMVSKCGGLAASVDHFRRSHGSQRD